ncbi:MAG: NUDIX domain-containing protein [Angustibacter sp.]
MSVDGHYAVVLLVDAHGRVLLQERDEHAPTAPLQWGCVGGSVEPGETAEQGAYRELAEETGIVLSDELRHWTSSTLTWSTGVTGMYEVCTASTTLTDDEIELGEVRHIDFVYAAALGELDLSESATHLLGAFLASDRYRELAPHRG